MSVIGSAKGVARSGLNEARRGHRAVIRRLAAGPGGLGIVGHHRIADVADDPWGLAMSPQDFDRHVQSIRDHGTIVPMRRELDRGRWQLTRDRSTRFAISSDDGYADNLHGMVPTLERHDAQAVVFVVTAFVGRRYFWWDRLDQLSRSDRMEADPEAPVRAAIIPGSEAASFAALDAAGRRERLHLAFVWADPAQIDAWMDALESELPDVPLGDLGRPLNDEELVELAAHPLVEVGVHSHEHRRLAMLEPSEVARQLETCRRALDHADGPADDRLLAYPYGDTSAGVTRVARSLGFRHAVTTEVGVVRGGDHPLRLPRIVPSVYDADELARQFG